MNNKEDAYKSLQAWAAKNGYEIVEMHETYNYWRAKVIRNGVTYKVYQYKGWGTGWRHD